MGDLLTWVRAQWDRAGGFALVAVGAVLVVSGGVGASATSDGAEQLSYLVSGGLGGLFCLGAGATFLLSAGFQDEWRKLDELTRAVRDHQGPADIPQGNGTSSRQIDIDVSAATGLQPTGGWPFISRRMS